LFIQVCSEFVYFRSWHHFSRTSWIESTYICVCLVIRFLGFLGGWVRGCVRACVHARVFAHADVLTSSFVHFFSMYTKYHHIDSIGLEWICLLTAEIKHNIAFMHVHLNFDVLVCNKHMVYWVHLIPFEIRFELMLSVNVWAIVLICIKSVISFHLWVWFWNRILVYPGYSLKYNNIDLYSPLKMLYVLDITWQE